MVSYGFNPRDTSQISHGHRQRIIDMERNSSSFWQPQINMDRSISLRGGSFKLQPGVGFSNANVTGGPSSVGFQEHGQYSDFYEKIPKTYKSSGNQGYKYYNSEELREINNQEFPYLNFTGNKINNNNLKYGEKPKIFKSILDVVEDTNDYSQLKKPENKPRGNKSRINMKQSISNFKNTPSRLEDKEVIDKIVSSFRQNQSSKALKGGKINQSAFKRAIRKVLPKNFNISSLISNSTFEKLGRQAAEKLQLPQNVGSQLGKLMSDIFDKKVRSGNLKNKISLDSKDKNVLEAIMKTAEDSKEGGKVNPKIFKKALKTGLKVGKVVGPPALKIGLPVLAGALGSTLGIPAPVSITLAKIASDVLAKQISGNKKGEGVMEYKGGRVRPSYNPKLFEDIVKAVKSPGVLVKRGGSGFITETDFIESVFLEFLSVLWKDLLDAPASFFKNLTGGNIISDLKAELGLPVNQIKKMLAIARNLVKKTGGQKGKSIKVSKKYGENTPQKKRAALVKKVMADKKISMIAASSLIKSQGMKY
jgi:hypothetical protein